jgi:hypothetical protein
MHSKFFKKYQFLLLIIANVFIKMRFSKEKQLAITNYISDRQNFRCTTLFDIYNYPQKGQLNSKDAV